MAEVAGAGEATRVEYELDSLLRTKLSTRRSDNGCMYRPVENSSSDFNKEEEKLNLDEYSLVHTTVLLCL